MPSKKDANLEMAKACYENSRKLYLDSIALKDRRSIGHAYSLLVLSIEESVKSILYRFAYDGLVRFSDGKGTDPTAVNEQDLLDHKTKHKILADIIAASILYAPFSTAFEGIPERKIEVAIAKKIMVSAIAQHQVLMADLSDPNSQTSKEAGKFFAFLESLNHEKNLGFYVDKKGSTVLRPNRVSRSKYDYWSEFQDEFLQTVKSIVGSGLEPTALEIFKKSRKDVARRLRRVEKQAKVKKK
jgi:AbiV family abortive infection protein